MKKGDHITFLKVSEICHDDRQVLSKELLNVTVFLSLLICKPEP